MHLDAFRAAEVGDLWTKRPSVGRRQPLSVMVAVSEPVTRQTKGYPVYI